MDGQIGGLIILLAIITDIAGVVSPVNVVKS